MRWIWRRTTRLGAMAGPGQSVVETALCFAILIPIIVGAVDLGRAYFGYDMLVHAVNEGVRRGSFDTDASNVVSAVIAAGHTLNLQAGDVAVTCYVSSSTTTKSCASMTIGDSVRVTAVAIFVPFTPVIIAILPGGTMTLTATAQRTYQ